MMTSEVYDMSDGIGRVAKAIFAAELGVTDDDEASRLWETSFRQWNKSGRDKYLRMAKAAINATMREIETIDASAD
jgi:hypothetical protein